MGNLVDNGRGHFVRSGTHAQVFTTPYSGTETDIRNDLEKYQGCIALALSIDPVRRVLDFDRRATLHSGAQRRRGCRQDALLKTSWNGSEWVNDKEENGLVQYTSAIKF